MPSVPCSTARARAIVAALTLLVSAGFAVADTPAPRPPRVAASALAQIQAIEQLKVGKNPAQSKLDSRLYFGVLHERSDPRLAPLKDFRFAVPDLDGRLPVDVMLVAGTGIKAVTKTVEQLGGVLLASSARFRRISARMPLRGVELLAAMPEVRRVRQAIPHLGRKIDTSEGDLTHLVQSSRALYGASGAGMKVCVISDGINSLADLQATGDLPAVDVLPGQEGTGDEGSAMLEIVHDLVPSATLGFASALPDEATFAQNILDLAADGCNVIVDDILYLDESPFQDGPVAQSVNSVTAGGVLYFSSAGNEGNANDFTSGTWEGDFAPNGTLPALPGAGPGHDFGDGGQSILVELGGGNPPLLIWAEHYDLATGNASTDFDLYDMDGGLTTVYDASVDTQDGVGGDDFPIEFIGGGTFGGERLVVTQFAAGTTTSTPMFNLIVFRGELDDALATSGATRGHSAALDAFSVAATPVAKPFDFASADGPYPGAFNAANESENFTSDGPRRIILSPTGAELTLGDRTSSGGVVRQKPDITAADGVSTAAPGFSPFYGTSAAAPHAAAIAALLKSAVPSLTPAQTRTALVSSAIDIELAGVDRDTGAGIVMADAALVAAGATLQAFLDDGTPVPAEVLGDGDAFVESNEVWSLTIPLTNIGGANATAITAVLTSATPGVTILSGSSPYPDLAPSAGGDSLASYVFRAGATVSCGVLLDFTLTATYSGVPSPQAFAFAIKSGQPGTPVTVSYSGAVVPIPDALDESGSLPGAAATADLMVAGIPGNIYDIDLVIDGTSCDTIDGSTTVGIDHSFVSDLDIKLRSPAATSVLVMNNVDTSGNNICQTVLDDESSGTSIQGAGAGDAPFTGSWIPTTALGAFDGEVANGLWQLQAQDFAIDDTGNIRAFSLIITPAVCDAPPLTAIVSGTKTVSGTFFRYGTITYTVTLTNDGGLSQNDNATDEFVDVLPSSLTLVSASATSGVAVATTGTNTVRWNGAIAPLGGSVTITITATVNAPANTVVSNQGAIRSDSNGDGSNETAGVTDDPGVVGTSDPTTFTVGGARVTATKTASGVFFAGGSVTYTIVLFNSGPHAALDNAGNELTDVLPATLELLSATATSGTTVATPATNTVTWSGSIPASGSVTITITAAIDAGASGQMVTNQATVIYDADLSGSNETITRTDDPGTVADRDATRFAVAAVDAIPTLTTWALLFMALALAAVAIRARLV